MCTVMITGENAVSVKTAAMNLTNNLSALLLITPGPERAGTQVIDLTTIAQGCDKAGAFRQDRSEDKTDREGLLTAAAAASLTASAAAASVAAAVSAVPELRRLRGLRRGLLAYSVFFSLSSGLFCPLSAVCRRSCFSRRRWRPWRERRVEIGRCIEIGVLALLKNISPREDHMDLTPQRSIRASRWYGGTQHLAQQLIHAIRTRTSPQRRSTSCW